MTPGRSIELSVEVPGTPEEVWATVATGPGITSWFVPMEVEERAGGQVVMDFGTFGRETARVVAWEPPRRFVCEGGAERTLTYEWLVEAGEGETCTVRLVNAGFDEGEGSDAEYEAMTSGWRTFLEHLRLQRTHFPGRRATALVPTASTAGPNAAAWSALCGALGVPEDLSEGDRFATADGAPPLAGTVVGTTDEPAVRACFLLLDIPAEGTAFVLAEGEGEQVMVSTYLYLYGPDGRAAGDEWTPWLTSRFEPVASP